MTTTQKEVIAKLAKCGALNHHSRNILADIWFHYSFIDEGVELTSVDIACISKIAQKHKGDAGIQDITIKQLWR